MDKYEASLSKEEIEAVQTGQAEDFMNRSNRNAMERNDTTTEYRDENSSSQNYFKELQEPAFTSQGDVTKKSMAQKMWEYFVNMMRQRHEKELERFLSQQPQGTVPPGDNPNDVKELWQKYINYTTSLHTVSDEKRPGEMEYLWSPSSDNKLSPLTEEGRTYTTKTQGWNNIALELDSLRNTLKTQRNEPPPSIEDERFAISPTQRMDRVPETDTTVKRGWDSLAERMKSLSAFDSEARRRNLFEGESKKRMEYFYEKQFPDSEESRVYQTPPPRRDYRSNYIEGVPPSQQRPAPPAPRGGNYNPYQGQPPYSNYSSEVNEMASTPFGQNRQTSNYGSPQQYGPGTRQVPSQRNMYNREYQSFPRDSQVNRRTFDQEDQLRPPAHKPPMFDQRRSVPNIPYTQEIPPQMEKPWRSTSNAAQEQVPSENKSTRYWQSGTRPFLQPQERNGELRRPRMDRYERGSRGWYNMDSRNGDCIHLTHGDQIDPLDQQMQYDKQPVQTDDQQTNPTYRQNISAPKYPDPSSLSSNTNP